MKWFLDNLEKELKSIPKANNVVDKCFRGEIEVHTYKPLGTNY